MYFLATWLALAVPPISLLALFWLVTFIISTLLSALYGLSMSTNILILSGGLLFISAATSWLVFGRHHIPLVSLLAAPFYVFEKLPIYLSFPFKRQKEWVRTDRTDLNPPASLADSKKDF